MSSQRRGPWSEREDDLLMRLVHQQGASCWVKVAESLKSRSAKQCRERYHQNLKPSLNKDPITPEEGQEIERMVQERGKRWAEIARHLNNRSDNAVKNWYNGSMNRRKRMVRRRASAGYEDNSTAHDYPQGLEPRLPTASLSSTGYAPRESVSPSTGRFPQPMWNTRHSGLPSPSTTSPRSNSFDGVPSLVSDRSSHYSALTTTTSPSNALTWEDRPTLPPMRPGSGPDLPLRTRAYELGDIPPLRSSKHVNHPRLPPIRVPEEEVRPQLPTAPNSPQELPFRPIAHFQPRFSPPHQTSSMTSRHEQPPGGTVSRRMNLGTILSPC
ncbi:Homeodomain-like protein [Xylariaceae sp. AK1471]|nr:Homeodomain-like protein [Xylariaceae sp. AK1471]